MKNKAFLFCSLVLLLTGCQEQSLKEEQKGTKVSDSQMEVEKVEDVVEKSWVISQSETQVDNQIKIESQHQHVMAGTYSEMRGILTFRGNNHRNQTSVGTWQHSPTQIEKKWEIQTGWNEEWGGGAGWTGQPLVIEWGKETVAHLGVYEKFKGGKLVEVIQASLDGNIYFVELQSGEQTRAPINIGNPIKGTPSLDPRGYPLLFVGEGIPQNPTISLNAIDLVENKIIYKFDGMDGFANRGWGAFDASPLISRETDTMVTNGENGIVYNIKLNTKYNEETGELSIAPEKNKMTFTYSNQKTGMESSLVAEEKYLFTADNKGMIQGIDSATMKTLWNTESYDDTDATMLFSNEESGRFLYTASEIDKQGEQGLAKIRKINAENGQKVWEKDFSGFSITGEDPVNGGFLASPLEGQGKLKGQVIFTMARGESLHSGYVVSLDKETGQEKWRWAMNNYAWSSPAGIMDEAENFYIIQIDSGGTLHLLKNGIEEELKINVGANVEASPIIYDNNIIFSSRGGQIFNYRID